MSSRAPRPHRIAAVLAALAVAGAMSGCDQAETVPSQEKEGVAAGVNLELGMLEAENLLIISTAEGEPGRLLGTLYANTEDAITVTFADDDEEITIELEGGIGPIQEDDPAGYDLQEQEHLFSTTADRPGGRAPVEITTDGATESVTIPVLDGSLERYEPFVPE
ncbi:hypothetical protein OH146_02075 [Salinibacterium sp. SYSU T00001]|uniref:hypothetical protein n=1 Tax=Homoserinimonas sedimenticola TaxID=2986805 RepID=UPI002236A4FD|nr:hypothetical protein [Salinibacterium sedimenticola]MCW4384556.1 hypothetical protein [Salinibacterium sedimenticola]